MSSKPPSTQQMQDQELKCARCASTFASKAAYARHINKKTPCKVSSASSAEISTFIDLYEFLRTLLHITDSTTPLRDWLAAPWVGKDKQESVLRLFAGLSLIPALSDFVVCGGNFNKGTIAPRTTVRDLFYSASGAPAMLKDSGDASDLTGICVSETKTKILATTSKNFKTTKYGVGDLGVAEILANFAQPIYSGHELVLCVAVPCCAVLHKIIERAHESSKEVVAILCKTTTIVVDWTDLEAAFARFAALYSTKSCIELCLSALPRAALALRPHQAMTVAETQRLVLAGAKNAVWGHVPRSGKSFAMAAFIAADAREARPAGELKGPASVGRNYLVITTAPNETLDQYESVFRCADLDEFSVFRLPRDLASIRERHSDVNSVSTKSKRNSIFICSKQYLQTKFSVVEVEPNTAKPSSVVELEPKPKMKASKKAKDKADARKTAKCMRDWLSTAITSRQKVVVDPELEWLASLTISARFVDESHFGGATELAQQTLSCFGAAAFTVYITATYTKPVNTYNIPRERCVFWTLADITACKRFADPDPVVAARARAFVETKYVSAEAYFGSVPPAQIAKLYAAYPQLTVLTRKITPEVIAELCAPNAGAAADTTYGWSAKACLLLNQSAVGGKSACKNTFQNPGEALKLLYSIFGGPKDKFGRPLAQRGGASETSFMERAAAICANGYNTITDTWFMPDTSLQGTDTDPAIILTFLPAANVDATSTALADLIALHNVLPEYDICIINSAQTTNPVAAIEEARARAKTAGKRAVLVLSGRQCSLGVTIPGCDVVILLNGRADDDSSMCGGSESGSTDLIYQMMFRSMTESKGKKFGFVFDLDLQRAMHTIVANTDLCRLDAGQPLSAVQSQGGSIRKAMAYLLQERIISLNPDHWEPQFGYNAAHADAFFEKAYKVYTAKAERVVSDIMDCIRLKSDIFMRNNCAFLRAFGKLKKTKKHRIARVACLTDTPTIPEGIEKTAIQSDATDAATTVDIEIEREEEDEGLDPEEMLRSLVPLLVLLTIHSNTTSLRHMLACVEADDTVREVLMDRTRVWWGDEHGTRNVLELLVNIHENHVAIDPYTQMRIENLKDVFVENKNCAAQLSAIIDTHLIPLESEKKAHAEVSTPAALRKEMLDKIPAEFWNTPKKVLEPCAGKGGFLVDMLDRFMVGLEPLYPDEEERRRFIIEECLYWADINPFNVWVCTLLLNLGGERKVNGYLGDSLALNTKRIWGISGGFDAVIGNPPYQTDPSFSGNTCLYNLFVEKYIDVSQYLLFVIPSRWFVGGKGLDAFRTFMTKRTDIVSITHEDDATKWFGKGVDIKGGAQYFLKDNTYSGPCMFNGTAYELSKYECVIKPQYHAIVDQCSALPSITELYVGRHFGVETNDSRLSNTDGVKCFVSISKSPTRIKYVPGYILNEKNSFWKVVTPEANGKAFGGFGVMFIGSPVEIHSGSYISFRVNSKEEAESLLSYLKTRFANHMLTIRKISQHINESVCKWIPLVPLDREWNDSAVCAHLGIDQASYTT